MTSKFRFGERSQTNLVGVHTDLMAVACLALELSPVDFAVTEGLRTLERQRELLAANKSRTLASRHITGHALDVAAYVNGGISWEWKYYEQIAAAFKEAAQKLDVDIQWGGDFVGFRDGCHFQLSRKQYPDGVKNG